jgi:hypothetical protein
MKKRSPRFINIHGDSTPYFDCDQYGYPRRPLPPTEDKRSSYEKARDSAGREPTLATFGGIGGNIQYGDAGDIVAHENNAVARKVKGADRLPTKIDAQHKIAFEKMGIKFLGPTEDKLFQSVSMPEGWTFEHSPEDYRTVYILDEKKRKRGYYWYKAASYDQAAYAIACRRFDLNMRYFDNYTREVAFVLDTIDPKNRNHVIFMAEAKFKKDREAFDDNSQKVKTPALAWIAANIPNIDDPCAYWDDPQMPSVGTFPPYGH